MLIRITTFTLGPNTRAVAERAADATARLVRSNPACVSSTFFADWDKGEYGLVACWQSREAADAASKANEPMVMELLGPHLKAPPTARIYEIYEPKV